MDREEVKKHRQEIAKLDCDSIYIGNLYTVDTDLPLPSIGKHGSTITWESKEILFLSHSGKVTRPTHGVGNRIVPLVATVTFEGETVQRTFDVTVLEEEYKAEIVEVYPVEVQTTAGIKPELPTVVVVRNDTGSRTVSHVSWEPIERERYQQPGVFTIQGKLEETGWKAEAKVTVKTEADEVIPHTPKVYAFGGQSVRLEADTEFAAAMNRSLEYLLSVDDDQMLYNFRAAAHLDVKGAKPMTGWDAPECNLKGHTSGHYLSALALAYSATGGNPAIKDKMDYMIAELGRCQNVMSELPGYHQGFLSAYSEDQFNLLEEYSTYPTIWAPYYTLHKIMAGLLDCYTLAGNKHALVMCVRLGDWVYRRLSQLSKEQRQKMWSLYIAGEFGGMNEVLTNLYLITQNRNYLAAAKYFDNEKLLFPMKENIDTLGDMHANQHIPQIIGALKLFEAEGEKAYYEAAKNFWRMVTEDHSYQIGGVGETEMFKEPGKIAAYLTDKTAETCASYNMLKLTKELFCFEPKKEYMDYYERTLYNHILATENSKKAEGGSTYFLPLAPGSCKKFDTHENTCCHGTGLENHFKYQESIYFHDQDNLFVNLYIPSTLSWKEKGITVSQKRNRGEFAETVQFFVDGGKVLNIRFRIPEWAAERSITVKMNDEIVAAPRQEDGYIQIQKVWEHDKVELIFPYTLRLVSTPDDARIKSVLFGPYVLAAIHEGADFITWPYSEEQFIGRMKKLEGEMSFTLGDMRFVPLYQIQDQRYHAYFKF
ncbi:glycoside hydrolase family 127 protein [Paenibacillus macerans]|uniref:beta-L-arabinofuranosidase domain-containing protein n=1 Tax=Paenibacillus macerans TaxID=44252 RepID=UPI002DB976C0|nr:beta-L-arabinofuranosidase domain-containing protein [Paenibacillus macerans]MEC0328090.1 glycoside hydrolase family 127 protein [Paenibacillus macerans]